MDFFPPEGRALLFAAVLEQLTHLAVGDQPNPADETRIEHEIGRTRYLERGFVVADPNGTIHGIEGGPYRRVTEPTDLMYHRFRFLDDEAIGNWTEIGLFGGDVDFIARAALLVDGAQAGDDRAGVDVIATGAYGGAANQTLTVTVTVGGLSGVAEVGWASTGAEPPGSAPVTFGTPVTLGSTGVALVFTGGVDGMLTQGDQWQLRLTIDSASPTFAAGGVYDPLTNEAGQVRTPGLLFRLLHIDPPRPKAAADLDVEIVTKVLNA